MINYKEAIELMTEQINKSISYTEQLSADLMNVKFIYDKWYGKNIKRKEKIKKLFI